MKKTFRIEYRDPQTDEKIIVVKEFEDTETISAREWAEDWAYSAADKGASKIVEVVK